VNSRIRRILEESGLNELAESSSVFWVLEAEYERKTGSLGLLVGQQEEEYEEERGSLWRSGDDTNLLLSFKLYRCKWREWIGEEVVPEDRGVPLSRPRSFWKIFAGKFLPTSSSISRPQLWVCLLFFLFGGGGGGVVLVFGFLSFLSLLICCQISQVSNAVILFFIIFFFEGKKKNLSYGLVFFFPYWACLLIFLLACFDHWKNGLHLITSLWVVGETDTLGLQKFVFSWETHTLRLQKVVFSGETLTLGLQKFCIFMRNS